MDGLKTIGLIGGVASGKSLVARMLAELGAGILDADRTGHEILATDAEIHAAIRQRWGESVFRDDGSIDRREIARRVFGADAAAHNERLFLEGLLHPRIRAKLVADRAQFASEGRAAVVLDAPLLLEAGWANECSIILMIESSRETRLRRALRRGWSEAEFDRREAAQWPIEQKREHAHYSLSNDGTESSLRDAVATFWQTEIGAI